MLHDFHLLTAEAAARLLKSIEEPPGSTTFVVLADLVPPSSSRSPRAASASTSARSPTTSSPPAWPPKASPPRPSPRPSPPPAATSPGRASSLPTRRSSSGATRSRRLPSRLDGTGRTVVETVEDLLARIDDAAAPLVARHAAELADLEARAERFGERGSGRRALEERQRRELRRHRTDELRSGLGVLAGAYRDLLVAGEQHRPEGLVTAVERIHEALASFEHNPNEPLLLQSLLWSLPATRVT